MKRIILLLFLSCACYLNVTAACKEVHKIGGTTHEDGPDTYRHVGESNDGTRLDCNGQGNLDCKWKDGTAGIGIIINNLPFAMEDADLYVQGAISLGQTSGVVFGDEEIGYFTWNGIDIHNYTFTLCDGE